MNCAPRSTLLLTSSSSREYEYMILWRITAIFRERWLNCLAYEGSEPGEGHEAAGTNQRDKITGVRCFEKLTSVMLHGMLGGITNHGIEAGEKLYPHEGLLPYPRSSVNSFCRGRLAV